MHLRVTTGSRVGGQCTMLGLASDAARLGAGTSASTPSHRVGQGYWTEMGGSGRGMVSSYGHCLAASGDKDF